MIFENAIIMAAGRGLRMKPLTDKIPKAMAPINSSTLIADRIKKEPNGIFFLIFKFLIPFFEIW